MSEPTPEPPSVQRVEITNGFALGFAAFFGFLVAAILLAILTVVVLAGLGASIHGLGAK